MAKMTSKERLLATIRHEEPDRVPISPRMNLWAAEVYGGYSWIQQLKLREIYDLDPLIWINASVPDYINYPFSGDYRDLKGVSVQIAVNGLDEANDVRRTFETPAGALTDRILMPHARSRYGLSPTPVHKEPLVKDIDDVPRLAFLLASPAEHLGGEIGEMNEWIGERGLLEVHPNIGPCQVTMALGGVAEAMVAYYENRELFVALIELFADYGRRQIEELLKKGAPVIFSSWHNLGVSAGWSPGFFREIVKPLARLEAELVHTYGALYSYFDNGSIQAILPDIAEIGADILSTLCPPPVGDVDLARAKATIGERVCLHGNVDAIEIVKRGTPEDVFAAVRETIAIGAPDGGYILGNSDCFFSGTPDENIRAFFEAAHQYAQYPAARRT